MLYLLAAFGEGPAEADLQEIRITHDGADGGADLVAHEGEGVVKRLPRDATLFRKGSPAAGSS